jgi:integrase
VFNVMALKWSEVDLDNGIVHIRNGYSRKDAWALSCKEKGMKDFPKGRKHHSVAIPPELLVMLRDGSSSSKSEFVTPSPFTGEMLSYEYYLETLKNYCRTLKIPVIGTHGLRHSTAELYQAGGATRDDLRQLFAHSSSEITDRYIHHKDNLDKVVRRLRVLPGGAMEEEKRAASASTSDKN